MITDIGRTIKNKSTEFREILTYKTRSEITGLEVRLVAKFRCHARMIYGMYNAITASQRHKLQSLHI